MLPNWLSHLSQSGFGSIFEERLVPLLANGISVIRQNVHQRLASLVIFLQVVESILGVFFELTGAGGPKDVSS